MAKSKKDAEAEVRSWGFSEYLLAAVYLQRLTDSDHVFTWTDGP